MKPRLLDLFCGAGGAAMGYHRAGFEVVGVDIKPQPHYPFEFIQRDAFGFLDTLQDAWTNLGARYFDAIHASPPCQGYSRLRHLPWLKGREYPMLIDPVRKRLEALGLPWVIENVEDAPMPYYIVLCGTQLGLPSVTRHRKFGSNQLLWSLPHQKHDRVLASGGASLGKRYTGHGVTGVVKEISRISVAGHVTGWREAAEHMGIDWMKREELTQAIPPAYTEWIGRQLLAAIERAAA
jgi:DNA (cytosine-5)-methyltransferase 1